MRQVEIYFHDLSQDKQKEILKAFEIEKPEDMNWDIYPVAIVPVNVIEHL